MNEINEFCEKCNSFRRRYCNGDRNTCMSILFERIEALQQENQQLRTRIRELEGELKEQRLAERMNSNEGIEKVKDLIAKLDKYMEQKKQNKESSDKDA